MEARLYNQSGEEVGVIQISDYVFGIEPNVPVMHQAMERQRANARLGTHNTLGRGEVEGSTRKLYRQKGTGRARQGSIRAPHRKKPCRAKCAAWQCARRSLRATATARLLFWIG
jgi:large subunit ribosomal protein L4